MVKDMDLTAQLPNGQMFEFWEVEQEYEREIHVDNQNPVASDDNEGTIAKPFKTINKAAQIATPVLEFSFIKERIGKQFSLSGAGVALKT